MLKPLGITNMYNSIREALASEVMSGYYVGIEDDLQQNYYGSQKKSRTVMKFSDNLTEPTPNRSWIKDK